MRAFVGVPVCGPAAVALLDIQARIPVGRPVLEENLHLTLAFLDDCPMVVLSHIADGLADLAAPAMDLTATHLDLIGGGRGPRLIAAMVQPDARLSGLRDRVRWIASEAGVAMPRARFRPHVTLVRFGNRVSPETRADAESVVSNTGLLKIGLPAERVVLYRSTLHQDGPVYDALAAFPLSP